MQMKFAPNRADLILRSEASVSREPRQLLRTRFQNSVANNKILLKKFLAFPPLLQFAPASLFSPRVSSCLGRSQNQALRRDNLKWLRMIPFQPRRGFALFMGTLLNIPHRPPCKTPASRRSV
jgi:hypothetical protein